jgi:hypothetical protein
MAFKNPMRGTPQPCPHQPHDSACQAVISYVASLILMLRGMAHRLSEAERKRLGIVVFEEPIPLAKVPVEINGVPRLVRLKAC